MWKHILVLPGRFMLNYFQLCLSSFESHSCTAQQLPTSGKLSVLCLSCVSMTQNQHCPNLEGPRRLHKQPSKPTHYQRDIVKNICPLLVPSQRPLRRSDACDFLLHDQEYLMSHCVRMQDRDMLPFCTACCSYFPVFCLYLENIPNNSTARKNHYII